MSDSTNPAKNSVSRRTVIVSGALIPIAAIQPAPGWAAPQTVVPRTPANAPAAAPATVFSPEQRRILEAFLEGLVPSDENGPGAVECGAANYIDLSLADYLAAERPAFLDGLAAVDSFARASQGAPFADLSPEKRDAVLAAIDSSNPNNNQAPNLRGFFTRVRRLTLEGMFCDPSYGGNKNFAGWDLIRYPGARLAVGPEDQRMKTPPALYRKPLYGDGHGH